MVSSKEELSISCQCELLDTPRSSFYYIPEPVSDEELDLMKLIDQCYLELPYYGTRRIKDWLYDEHGLVVNRKRIQRLRRLLAIETLYPKRNLSLANQKHKVYPYLLRGLEIDRPNQVWSTDITYIPMAKGFIYLIAVMDWYSRKVLSWQIFNTDQGSQFTSEEFTGVLKANDIAISMDGKGRWVDNVFVERLWRSVKYEELYLNAYDTVAVAKSRLGAYFERFNTKRRHQGINGLTPDMLYTQPVVKKAA